MTEKVIITGANGFIGRALTEYMISQGHEVTGWDVHNVDMTRLADIESALDGCTPDIIIHCAGSANVSDSVANPDRDFALNVGITHNLLNAMQRKDLNHTRLVYLSSAAVYGNPKHLPISETDEIHPISPYALHKTMCEDMCRYFVDNHGFDIRIARIFSAYGSGLKKQIFWDMYQKYRKTGRLEMYGDGTESRDFIHIDDLKNALYLIALDGLHTASQYASETGQDSDPADRMIINVANGEEITISHITELFADYMGIPRSAISFNGIKRPGDPYNWRADIDRLHHIGYNSRISIDEGVRRYCDWLRESCSA